MRKQGNQNSKRNKIATLGFAMERLCCALKSKTRISSTFDEFVAINTAYPNCRCVLGERGQALGENDERLAL